jgi:hypothetical protein
MTDTDSAEYTVRVNGKQFELNEDARTAIQTRAKHEYSENPMFSCFWKVADPSQYEGGEWDETIHNKGDPVLVIETEGPMVPWERIDKLNVEMQEVGPQSQLDREMDDSDDADGPSADEMDNGNGLKTIDPDAVDDSEKTIGRTHFGLTPQSFEEVPSPDGEEPDKIPQKPEQMDDGPSLITWVPDHPDVEHTWTAGEAICPIYTRFEWNVQVKANQPRPTKEKDDSHDHWESLLKSYECDKLAELGPSQRPSSSSKTEKSEEEVDDKFKNGKYGGGNWHV